MIQVNLFTKKEQTHRVRKQTYDMQNRQRDTVVQNRLLDSVGEGEGGGCSERIALKQVYHQG